MVAWNPREGVLRFHPSLYLPPSWLNGSFSLAVLRHCPWCFHAPFGKNRQLERPSPAFLTRIDKITQSLGDSEAANDSRSCHLRSKGLRTIRRVLGKNDKVSMQASKGSHSGIAAGDAGLQIGKLGIISDRQLLSAILHPKGN